MSIPEYFKTLSYDQLIFARSHADTLIKKKDNESKRKLWRISDDGVNLAFFDESEHKKAAERMASETIEYANKYPGNSIKMDMRLIAVRESEYQEYLDL